MSNSEYEKENVTIFPCDEKEREQGLMFTVTVGNCRIKVDSLRIESNTNFKFPHKIIGIHSRIDVNDRQLIQYISQFLTYRVDEFLSTYELKEKNKT